MTSIHAPAPGPDPLVPLDRCTRCWGSHSSWTDSARCRFPSASVLGGVGPHCAVSWCGTGDGPDGVLIKMHRTQRHARITLAAWRRDGCSTPCAGLHSLCFVDCDDCAPDPNPLAE